MYIGNDKQLFIDDYIIESVESVHKTLNQPIKYSQNPVLGHDQPWEEPSWGFASVMYDQEEKTFKMWYGPWESRGADRRNYYATSRDGIHWEKPNLGLVEFKGTEKNNIIFPLRGLGNLDGPSVFKDPGEADPSRRYKMFYGHGFGRRQSHICVAFSPDGIHWTPYEHNPIIFQKRDGPYFAFWDESLEKYVAYIRQWIPYMPESEDMYTYLPLLSADYNRNRLRAVGRVESDDFTDWTTTREDGLRLDSVPTVMKADLEDPPENRNFYGMVVTPYESVYLGFLHVLHVLPHIEHWVWQRKHTDYWILREEILKVIPWYDTIDVQLTFSRDGKTWQRSADRAVFLPRGPTGEGFDWGMVWVHQPPLVVGDEIWIYYTGWSNRHSAWSALGETLASNMGLAKLRLDGFVSVDADDRGSLTTKAFTFEGDGLEINANAAGGAISVEVLDSEAEPISGFSEEDCRSLTSDEVHHKVRWESGASLEPLGDVEIKLRFYLNRAKLYSFKITRPPS